MKRLSQFATDFLLVSVVAIFLLGACAELERRDEAELRAMQTKHQVAAKAVKWRDLDEAGRRMTSFDLIGKKK